MRLLLLSCISLLLAFNDANAFEIHGSGVIATSGGDDCAGDIAMTWHMEDVDVTIGTPAGCSDYDTSATDMNGATLSTDQANDGTSSFLHGPEDSYAFDVPNATIEDTGTICQSVYVADWSVGTDFTRFFRIYIDDNDSIALYWKYDGSATDITFRAEGSNDNDTRTRLNLAMPDATWLRMCVSWDLNDDAVDSLWLWVDLDADDVMDEGEYAETTTATVGNWAGSGTLTLEVGSTGGNVYYTDTFYHDTTYQNTPP